MKNNRKLKKRGGFTLIEIMLDPEAITTRVTLSAITQNALKTK